MQKRLNQFCPFPLASTIFVLLMMTANGRGAPAAAGITPIPMEFLNPRLTEFRRIDSNNDDSMTFSEYLMSDRPWMETLSRRFHQLDQNSDGRVTRKEFEAFFRGKEEAEERQRAQADNFFKQLTVTVGPIVEREQTGNATNGASRMHYFSAGSRKFAAGTKAHGTGTFPSSSSSVDTSSAELSPRTSAIGHGHGNHNPHLFSGDFFNRGQVPVADFGRPPNSPLWPFPDYAPFSACISSPFLPSAESQLDAGGHQSRESSGTGTAPIRPLKEPQQEQTPTN